MDRAVNPDKCEAAVEEFFDALLHTPRGVGYTMQALMVYTKLVLGVEENEVRGLMPATPPSNTVEPEDWVALAAVVKDLMVTAVRNSTETLQ